MQTERKKKQNSVRSWTGIESNVGRAKWTIENWWNWATRRYKKDTGSKWNCILPLLFWSTLHSQCISGCIVCDRKWRRHRHTKRFFISLFFHFDKIQTTATTLKFTTHRCSQLNFFGENRIHAFDMRVINLKGKQKSSSKIIVTK